jgi:hypothetical protein
MWTPTHAGTTKGTSGSEGGIIVCDDEQPDGSRITLERDGHAPWSITCGIPGVMVHTRFFATEAAAATAYPDMQTALDQVIEALSGEPTPGSPDPVGAFIERFP